MEAIGRESVAAVVRVLSEKACFPWIETIEETERLGKMDVAEKTDLIVYVDNGFLPYLGCIDAFRIQVKSDSGWDEVRGVGEHGFELLGLTSREWRELYLILLFGKQCTDSITASFLGQVMNHMGIWGNEAKVTEFMSRQSEKARLIFNRYQAQDLIGRDWQRIFDYVRGNGVKEIRRGEGGGEVKIYRGNGKRR